MPSTHLRAAHTLAVGWRTMPTTRERRIQVASATVDLKAASSSAMASAGVLHPRVFLGRLFIRAATSFSQVWLASLRSVPLGMNWRTSSVKRLIRGIHRSAEDRWCSRCCRAAKAREGLAHTGGHGGVGHPQAAQGQLLPRLSGAAPDGRKALTAVIQEAERSPC